MPVITVGLFFLLFYVYDLRIILCFYFNEKHMINADISYHVREENGISGKFGIVSQVFVCFSVGVHSDVTKS